MSACLAGTDLRLRRNGERRISQDALKLLQYENVKIIKFCPEEFSFGTPREMCDIHGGTGYDVLNGKAKVLTETGKDWTAAK